MRCPRCYSRMQRKLRSHQCQKVWQRRDGSHLRCGYIRTQRLPPIRYIITLIGAGTLIWYATEIRFTLDQVQLRDMISLMEISWRRISLRGGCAL